jgi:hypothetical protein
VSESDELVNCRDKVAQAQQSIHTDISRNRRQCSVIREAGRVPQADWRLSSAPRSRLTEIQVDEIHKVKKKWNGAGTFRSLVTLKEDERCETRRRTIIAA